MVLLEFHDEVSKALERLVEHACRRPPMSDLNVDEATPDDASSCAT